MEKKTKETSANIKILESELELRKQEVISQHDRNVILLKQNEELQDVIEECNINIEVGWSIRTKSVLCGWGDFLLLYFLIPVIMI